MILEGESKGKRSESQMKVITALVGRDCDDRVITYILEHYPIGDKFREKGSDRKAWLMGEIGRSRKYITVNKNQLVPESKYFSEIQELNKKHAVVMLGGKCVILNEKIDPIFNRNDVTFSSIRDFQNFYSNRRVPNPRRDNLKSVSIADNWLESKQRRQYDGIIFDPEKEIDGYYNLFRGFAVEPKKGDWSLFKKHIRKVIAGGNEDAFRYIIAWMSHLVQKPGRNRPGTAIVLRGKQGTGKGCFVSEFGKIFGNHFLQINNQNQLTGRFNNHLKDALLVFCDEGIWAGDKYAEGVLKGMITEEQIMIEPKGKDAFPVKNNIRLIVASNNNWVVPAGLEDRRFFVLDVSDKYMQNREYFKSLFEQMGNGGREAMLYHLMNYDLTGIDLGNYPRTGALMDQIISSMRPVQKFWYELLKEGTLSSLDSEWKGIIPSVDLYNDYIKFAEALGEKNRPSKSQFGKELNKMCPQVKRKKLKAEGANARRYHQLFPSLEECRKTFESIVKMEIDWEDDTV